MFHILNITIPIIAGSLLYSFEGPFRNYGPDALWAYPFTFSLLTIWGGIHKTWLCVLAMVFILFEVLQQVNIVPGTFDLLDILCYFLSSIISIFIYEKNKPFSFHPRRDCIFYSGHRQLR